MPEIQNILGETNRLRLLKFIEWCNLNVNIGQNNHDLLFIYQPPDAWWIAWWPISRKQDSEGAHNICAHLVTAQKNGMNIHTYFLFIYQR